MARSPRVTEHTVSAADLGALVPTGDLPCPTCGYNLRGVAQPACPECGKQPSILLIPPVNMKRIMLLSACLASACVFFTWVLVAYGRALAMFGLLSSRRLLIFSLMAVGTLGTFCTLAWMLNAARHGERRQALSTALFRFEMLWGLVTLCLVLIAAVAWWLR
jgi:hypothetical protein